MHSRDWLNRWFDRVISPQVRILRKPRSAFQVFGVVGALLAIALAAGMAVHLRLRLPVIGMLALAAAFTFFAVIMATKIVTGVEQIIYYHHEIAVVAVSALLLWRLHQPVLPYLDLMILGIGTFLFCGRIGCLMVGCCHGRPCRFGVCYQPQHAAAGFNPDLVSVRLFPIQGVESLSVFCIVTVGASFVLMGYPAGAALTWYVVAYDLARFSFEFMRGDSERPYFWGFSQAQWISVLLMYLVVWGEHQGFLPYARWHTGVAAGLSLWMASVALKRRIEKTDKFRLLHPRHIAEVAAMLQDIAESPVEPLPIGQWTILPRQLNQPSAIPVACTSMGVQISRGQMRDWSGRVDHYTFSLRNGGMTEETARVLAGLILQLNGGTGSSEFVTGNRDVFHLLISPKALTRSESLMP